VPVEFEQTIAQKPIIASQISSGVLKNPAVVFGLLLVLATLLLYNPAGRHPFINYDDDRYVTDNLQVRHGLTWQSIQWAFTTTEEANWHPLTWLSHELDWQLFHLNPGGHHYVNVLLQAINAWLLFLVLRQATGFVRRSWMVAAIFALHPINVESVAWVSERKNLLSMFFFLVALASYRRYALKPGLGRYGLVAILFALGLMAKPQVITFPFVLLLWDYWPLQRMRCGDKLPSSGDPLPTSTFARLVREKVPLLALSAASALVTLKAQAAGGAVRTTRQLPMSVRLGNAVISYIRYLEKAFWPSHLALMYPYLWSRVRLGPVLLSLLLLGLISVLVIAAHRRYLLVGWLWFLGTAVPMIGLVQVGGQAMADRYAYLPFIGLFLMVCWGAAEIAQRRRWPVAMPVAAALIGLAALGITARRQLGYWSDSVTLWSHAIDVTGPNFDAQEHLGSALAAQGRMAEAGAHFEVGMAIDAEDPNGIFNLAVNDQFQGRVQRAIAGYRIVLQRSSDRKLEGEALNNLAMAYREAGNSSQAETTYRAAVLADPSNHRSWMGMGVLEQRLGKFALAAEAFSRSAAIQPSAVDYLLLEKALERSEHTSEAVAAHQKAEQLSPDLRSVQPIADALVAP